MSPDEDRERRLLFLGAASAPALVSVGLLVLALTGDSLPSDCRGLACLAVPLLVSYGGALLLCWLVVAAGVRLLRRRTGASPTRAAVLRGLVGLSWVVAAAPVALGVT
jgi:hypothetical protein